MKLMISKVFRNFLNWALFFCLVTIFTRDSAAFELDVMNSVVSVIPRHSGFESRSTDSHHKRISPEGTAVAIFPGGYLATNSHVLGSAKSVDIRMKDGRLIAVQIIGQDRFTDIALIKAPVDLPVLDPAPTVELAGPVCAVGNQFGLGLSVTCGVVSAIHRTGTGFNPIEDFIQTDAVVNPGGSGGALVNDLGQIIGLVSAIFTKESDSNIGVNFATSINMVLRVTKDLKEFGRVKRGRSGIRVGFLSQEQRRTVYGALITHVNKESAGFRGGLRPGNVITKIGLRHIFRPTDVSSAFHQFRPGNKVTVDFFDGGKKSSTTIELLP